MITKEELIKMRNILQSDSIDDPEDLLEWFAENGIDLINEIINYRSQSPLTDK